MNDFMFLIEPDTTAQEIIQAVEDGKILYVANGENYMRFIVEPTEALGRVYVYVDVEDAEEVVNKFLGVDTNGN